ncbi:MAG: histone deacetylase family protein [Hyphomicrobiaceae bacterium]
MPTLHLTHASFLNHLTGDGHPERPDRLRAISKVLEHELFNPLVREEPALRDDIEEQILLAHPKTHIERIKAARPPAGGELVRLDPDTVMSPGSWEAALRAVGSGLDAVDAVFDKKSGIKNAFCQVRPCGHHAEADKAMGFCLFSNIAIAGKYARAKHGAERIAVVDFDVHHGNGTQNIFWNDKDLFFASSHQMPLFPGSGALSETGVGNIWNAPLAANDDGEKFRDAFENRILPALKSFHPDIILISAGFDAHKDDPLASLALVESDFMWVTEQLALIADAQCDGRIVSMLEGGYNLAALARSVGVHVRTLMDASS